MSQWNDHAHVWDTPEPDSYCKDCGIDRRLAAEVDVLAGGSLTTNSPVPMAVTLQFDTPEDLLRWLEARAALGGRASPPPVSGELPPDVPASRLIARWVYRRPDPNSE